MLRANHLVLVLVAASVGVLTPAAARSGAKPNCRDLTFAGAAGAASNDKVTLKLVDSGGIPIDLSCQLQVQNNETARAFAARLVGGWGPGNALVCATPNPLPKKTCGNGAPGKSCNHKFKFKPDKTTLDPDDGLILVRICCYESDNCKGPKLSLIPVSAQTKVDPAVTFSPTVPPPVGITVTPVALDPIGMTQRPFAALQTCRMALGGAVTKLTVTGVTTLVMCHRDVMQGRPLPPTECNQISPASDPGQKTEAAAQAVRAVATTTCESGGQSPSNVGYSDTSCPCPCQHIAPHTCRAGRVGMPCSSDPECDQAAGGGDGRCTLPGWSLVGDCTVCLAETAVTKAVATVYGNPGPGPGLPPPEETCAETVGDALASLVRVHVTETAGCQRLADSGKLGLPPGTSCRDADPKHRRSAAEQKTAAMIQMACPGGVPPQLGCSGTPDPAPCVLAEARMAAASATGAAFPDTAVPQSCSPGGAFLDAVD